MGGTGVGGTGVGALGVEVKAGVGRAIEKLVYDKLVVLKPNHRWWWC